jgi:hypothetical protein
VSRFFLGVLLPLTAAGCFSEESHLLVPSGPGTPVIQTVSHHVSLSPGDEALNKHVNEIGQRILQANKLVGVVPNFVTIGANQVEVFHQGLAGRQGDRLKGSTIFLTDGLVHRCKGDGQVAAVVCYEMARMVAERESLLSPSAHAVREPIDAPVGHDNSDNTRMMELARIDHLKPHPGEMPPSPPDPILLARRYLRNAGFESTELDDVMPLIEEAGKNINLEKTVIH